MANISLKNQKGRKLEQRYKGPLIVVYAVKGKFSLEDLEGRRLKNPVHKSHFKIYKEAKDKKVVA